jgi:DNA-binding FadR family transcriptional regulator
VSAVASARDQVTIRVPKTAELVANHIRRQIVDGQLHEDDALPPETALMEEFGISRPTLREAFRILESEGLITVRRGARGGARVQEPSADTAAQYAGLVLQHRNTTLADVLDARVIVEAPAARILAERRDRARIAKRLTQLLEEPAVHDATGFDRFNRLMVELTDNQTLILLTTMIEHICRAAALDYHADANHDERLRRKADRTREQLIELVRAGDGDAAEDLWRRHLSEAGKALLAGSRETVVDLFG